ncbi:hypothetical protein [Streptosporangium sp. NPDC049078]|uniref:hypothetical protein n=1 Tax=Streptosporangium sp. NPDC049078 TaxID=3155767 RepID=UPI00343EAEC0
MPETPVMPTQSPAVDRRPASLSAASLPLHTLKIFGACALTLILWFSVGRVVRELLMVAASEVSHGDHRQVRLVVTMFVFTLIVLTELVVMVGMLHSVRGALREIRARREAGEADESMFGALNRATLVFATIYLAWGFHTADAREFIAVDTARRVDQDFASSLAGNEIEGGTGLSTLDVRVSIGVAVVAYLLRMLFARWHLNGRGRGSGVLATFFELAFAFYSINALLAFAEARADWLDQRVVVVTFKEWAEAAGEALPWWKPFWNTVGDAVGDTWPHVVDGLIVPLTWLTVASLVYGAFAEDTRAVVRGTRLDGVATRVERAHDLTRSTMTHATAGFQERWVPPANAFRLAAKGGPVLFGALCLCYVAIRVVTDYADRGVRMLIGNEDPFVWVALAGPVEFVRELVVLTLTVCLLAATFDIAATRGREAGRTLTA